MQAASDKISQNNKIKESRSLLAASTISLSSNGTIILAAHHISSDIQGDETNQQKSARAAQPLYYCIKIASLSHFSFNIESWNPPQE